MPDYPAMFLFLVAFFLTWASGLGAGWVHVGEPMLKGRVIALHVVAAIVAALAFVVATT